MSLKFAAVGSLTVIGAFGTRTGDEARKLARVEPYYDPLLAMVGFASSTEQNRPETSERAKHDVRS